MSPRLRPDNSSHLTFGRRDATTGNTYIALVSAFELEPFSTPDEVLAIRIWTPKPERAADRACPRDVQAFLAANRAAIL